MKKISRINYTIETDNVNMKLLLLTDLHYYNKKDIKRFNSIIDNINDEKIDAICVVGDFIDSADIDDIDLLADWFKRLSSISKVIISLGGHDIVRKVKRKKEYYYNEELFNELKKIKNVYDLDNKDMVIDNVRFIGLTLPLDYYYKYKESILYFKKYVNNTFDTYTDKYNILLCHTPIPLTKINNYDEVKLLKNISLVLSGHTHAGIVPKFMRKIMRGRGIFSPHKGKMFQKNFYGLIKKNNANIVISTGFTKASHCNPFRFLDRCFDREINIIDLKKKG